MKVVYVDTSCVSNMPKPFDEARVQPDFEKDRQMMTVVYKQMALAQLLETGTSLFWELSNDGDTYRAAGKFINDEVSE